MKDCTFHVLFKKQKQAKKVDDKSTRVPARETRRYSKEVAGNIEQSKGYFKTLN
jgi:hypothetical protein